jgi:hypothetical protein
MRMPGAEARITALACVAIALAGWNLRSGFLQPGDTVEASQDAPELRPELVEYGLDPAAAEGAVGHQDARQDEPASMPVAWQQAWNPVQAVDRTECSEVSFDQQMEVVFAPSRLSSQAWNGVAGEAPGSPAGQAVVWGGGDTSAAARLDRGAEPAEAKARAVGEKACFEEFMTIARSDPGELERLAGSVLREEGNSFRKVALLRALYATDHVLALGHFARAISSLPDVSSAQGVSVPVFAAGFLARQTEDPVAKALTERIAWNGYLNVSPALRRSAAEALVVNASDADLQRYASAGYLVQSLAEVAGTP